MTTAPMPVYVSAMGLSFSETVLVAEGGAERLTQAERALFVRSAGPPTAKAQA